MALFIFKYGLPILLGYTLFVGISGRYLPLPRPKAVAKRPSWFLAIWTGISVTLVATLGLHFAYQLDLSQLSTLFTPGAWIFAAMMIPGIIGFLGYRSKVKAQILAEKDSRQTGAIDNIDSMTHDNSLSLDSITTSALDDTVRIERQDILDIDEQTTIWTEDFDSAELVRTDFDETNLFEIDEVETHEPVMVKDEHSDQSATLDTPETAAPMEVAEAPTVDKVSEKPTAGFYPAATGFYPPTKKVEISAESEVAAENDLRTAAELSESIAEVSRLREQLEAETTIRKEVETHLRITRSGLGALESESREFAANKAAALMVMEQELEEKIKRTSAAEARADREATKRADLESQMVHLREDALKATNESRVSVEARAKALSTANKATTLARQAMEIRTRLETQLQDAQTDIDSKQQTISSLIKALEKAKSRTQEDVASMAKQLILHDKQLQARRTLEEVSRSVDNKLSTRLVKKVAKARSY